MATFPSSTHEAVPKRMLLTDETLVESAAAQPPPCLSLYQPTHRRHSNSREDRIRFGNLVKELASSLRQHYPAVETQQLLKPFEALAQDHDFWNHTLDGLAVLAGAERCCVFTLPRSVRALAVVADSFHTKPLRRFLQSIDRYQVLGLSLSKVRMFEGNRDALVELELDAGVPRTITDALGEELTEPRRTVASYGGVGGASTPMHHGQGGRRDEVGIDADRFFRAVDRAVLEHYSRPSGLPLILAALPEHHHRFHLVSHNPLLAADGIKLNPDALSTDDLRQRAWKVVEPQYQARLQALCDEFALAVAKGLGSNDLAEVAQAATAGRVATLLIEADRQIAGRIDGETGRLEAADLGHPRIDDMLDDLGELVGHKGGHVLVLPTERMPSLTGLAAIYRY